jgi:DNA-binding transcriptional LysR family regulator
MRPLDLELLCTFVAVVDRQSFALAAEQVHRTQSAVTQQMARLEEQLGVALFQKVGRSKRLTPQGVRLLDYARRMLELNDEALQSLAAPDLRGPLRIGCIHDASEFLLPVLLARFSQLFPNVQVEVHPARTAHLLQALERGEIEIALVASPEGTEERAHPHVRLRTSPVVWMAASDYVLDASQPVPLVVPDEPSAYRAMAIAALDAHGIAWRIRHVSTSLAFSHLRAALRARLGVSVRIVDADPRAASARRGRRSAAAAADRARAGAARQARVAARADAVRVGRRGRAADRARPMRPAHSILTSTRRASALPPLPVAASGFFSSTLSSATPADFSASRTANARCLASSAFFVESPVASWKPLITALLPSATAFATSASAAEAPAARSALPLAK